MLILSSDYLKYLSIKIHYTKIRRLLLEFICIRLYTENDFTKFLYTNYVLLCLSKHNIIGLTLKIIIL